MSREVRDNNVCNEEGNKGNKLREGRGARWRIRDEKCRIVTVAANAKQPK